MQDPRCKHQYLDEFPKPPEDDESDKHLEARDRRYSRLNVSK